MFHLCKLIVLSNNYVYYCVYLQVIWKRLYKLSSSNAHGTLYQLRNVINRRNVVRDPSKNVEPCEKNFMTVLEAHFVSAAIQFFQIFLAPGTSRTLIITGQMNRPQKVTSKKF